MTVEERVSSFGAWFIVSVACLLVLALAVIAVIAVGRWAL